MTLENRLWLVALALLACFVLLGLAVSRQLPSRLDVEAGALRGTATGAAVVFTQSGRFWPLVALAVLGTMIFLLARWPLWIPLAILISQIVSQGIIEATKAVLHRTRPDDWLFHHELGYSYPSGHACTAIVFFGAYALAIARLPLARGWKISLVVLLVLWMAGIDWSRVALGAHYLTDVVGGTLFGVAWLCGTTAVAIRLVAGGRLPFFSG